jgi:hypothetical protein
MEPGNVFQKIASRMCKADMLMDLAHIADMGNNGQAIAASHIRDLPELRDSRKPHDIGLHIMYCSGMDEVSEL